MARNDRGGTVPPETRERVIATLDDLQQVQNRLPFFDWTPYELRQLLTPQQRTSLYDHEQEMQQDRGEQSEKGPTHGDG